MFCWWCFPRDSLCVSATSMRPVCDLHDCSQIKMPFGNAFLIKDIVYCQDWWFGLLSSVFLCFYTPFNVKIPTPNCMKMHHLKWRITKIFSPGVPPPRTPPPLGASMLVPSARGPMGNCHGSPKILETLLLLIVSNCIILTVKYLLTMLFVVNLLH